MSNNHYYFTFKNEPRPGVVPKVTVEILNFYARKNLSKKIWVKEPEFYLGYTNFSPEQPETTNSKNQTSLTISYGIIAKHLHSNNSFSCSDFNLPLYECFWLDNTIDIQMGFHKFDLNSTEALGVVVPLNQAYGKKYPITLKLDREGHLYKSLQNGLIKHILKNRKKLVEESNKALTVDWILDLRNLISDTVSLVDITLNQLYTKAEYDPLPHWNFDKVKLGDKFGRRFKDKLKWVHQISGNPLDNARDELISFNNLRRIRNHMMHFDPPSFVVTLEEIEIWLNQIIDVAFLLAKIRDKIGITSSESLATMMLQKDVLFIPEKYFAQRLPLNSQETGYLSSCWPENDSERIDEQLISPENVQVFPNTTRPATINESSDNSDNPTQEESKTHVKISSSMANKKVKRKGFDNK